MNWFAFDCVGYFFTPDSENICFKAKKEALEHLTCSYLDRLKRPMVRRIGEGYYLYTPHPCDGGTDNEITIIREDVIDKYGFKQLIEDYKKNGNNE